MGRILGIIFVIIVAALFVAMLVVIPRIKFFVPMFGG